MHYSIVCINVGQVKLRGRSREDAVALEEAVGVGAHMTEAPRDKVIMN